MRTPFALRVVAAALVPFVLGCCSRSDAQDPASKPTDTTTKPTSAEMNLPKYAGPQCNAVLAATAPKATVTVEANTGGFEYRLDRVVDQGATARIETTLVSPGDGEMVTQAFETKRLEVDLPAKCTTVLVLVSQEKRGVAYFRKPDYLLAQTLTRTR